MLPLKTLNEFSNNVYHKIKEIYVLLITIINIQYNISLCIYIYLQIYMCMKEYLKQRYIACVINSIVLD